MLKNFTFLKAFDLNLFTHYSIFIALFFSIFSLLCSHQPPMVVHQGHKKSYFFPTKIHGFGFTKNFTLHIIFWHFKKKKYNVAKKKKTKDLMWILWKKPVWSSILNDPAWWRAFHNKPIFEKNVLQFRELYIVCLKTIFRNIRFMLDEMIMQNAITWFFLFFKNIANYLLYYFSFFS